MTYHITLTDPMNGTRDREPITFTLPEKLQEPLWWAITSEDQRILCQHLTHESTQNSTAFIATVSFSGIICSLFPFRRGAFLRLLLRVCRAHRAYAHGFVYGEGKEHAARLCFEPRRTGDCVHYGQLALPAREND